MDASRRAGECVRSTATAVAPDNSTSSQMHDQLETGADTVHLRQQAEHHETEAEIVGLGQRVQARERIRKAQQPDGAGEKEERTRDNRDHRPQCRVRGSSSRPRCGDRSPSVCASCAFTKAKEANAASSASVNATSIVAASPVAAPSSSTTAMPPVPSNCAAIMRSASPGPRRMRTSPSATIARMNAAAPSRNSAMAPSGDQRPGQQAFLLPESAPPPVRRCRGSGRRARPRPHRPPPSPAADW